MNATLSLASIDQERESRLQSRLNQGAEAEKQFETALSEFAEHALATRARVAYEFSKAVPYHHPGLSSASYLAHPTRVAGMALRLVRPCDEDAVVLALLHNVFEVSDVTPEEIGTRFGTLLANAIRDLTVDRAQTGRDYKVSYYRRLHDGPRCARLIKLFDKLDNLFLLCLNPSAETRSSYLAEIEEFILPIAQKELPLLAPYLETLVADCRSTGYLESAAQRLQSQKE